MADEKDVQQHGTQPPPPPPQGTPDSTPQNAQQGAPQAPQYGVPQNAQQGMPQAPQSGGSHAAGVFGALLGAIVGALPLMLLGLLTGIYSGWLGFLVAFGSAKGYELFHGARKKSFAVAMVSLWSVLTILVCMWLSAALSLLENPDILAMAKTLHTGAFTAANLYLLGNIPLMMVSYILPIGVSLLGIVFAARRLAVYTQPELMKRAVQAAQQTLVQGVQTRVHFFEPRRLRGARATSLMFMLPAFIGIFGLMFGMLAFMESMDAFSAGVMLPFFGSLFLIGVVAIGIIIYQFPIVNSGDSCYARDGAGTLYRVRLSRLNQLPNYQFGTYLGLGVMNYAKLTPDKQALLCSSVIRVVEDMQKGQFYPGSAITMAVQPFYGLTVQKEAKWGWKCVYRMPGGAVKSIRIPRAFGGGFHPLGQLPPTAPDEPTRAQPVALLLGFLPVLLCAGMFAVALMPQMGDIMARSRVETVESLAAHVYTATDFNDVSVEIDDSWVKEEGGSYTSADGTQRYRIAVSALGGGQPADIWEYYMENMRAEGFMPVNSANLRTSGSPRPATASDGTKYQLCMYGAYDKNNYNYQVALLLCEDKNTMVSIQGSWSDELPLVDTVQEQLERMLDSVAFHMGEADEATGNTFLGGDGSELCLMEDGTFAFYQTEGDHAQQYYLGTYEVAHGQAAVELAASMEEYGITAEEIEEIIRAGRDGYTPGGLSGLTGQGESQQICKDTFYAMVLHNEKLVLTNGYVAPNSGNTVLYIGYYLPQTKTLDFVNGNTGSHVAFTYKAKTVAEDAAPAA